jgi:hypothetical protein
MFWPFKLTTYFWPGFDRAWNRLDHVGVFQAVAFAWLFIFVGVANFYWPDWFHTWFVRLVTFGVLGASIVHGSRRLLFGNRDHAHLASRETQHQRDNDLRAAQESYLQGAYFEAEQYLHKNLAVCENDIESALLLATVFRRNQKPCQAIELLSQLELRERAARWYAEIAREKELAIRAKRQSNTFPPPKAE